MSNLPYNKRLERLSRRIDVYKFNVDLISDFVSKAYESVINNNNDKLIVKVKFLLPCVNSEDFNTILQERKVKTYERFSLLRYINSKIKNSIKDKESDYNYSYKKAPLYKERISFRTRTYQRKLNDAFQDIYEVLIEFAYVKALSVNDITTALKILFSGKTNFCDEIRISIYNGNLKKENCIAFQKLEKTKISEDEGLILWRDRDELTDYYSTPEVNALVFEYLFPYGEKSDICKITFDKLRRETEALKSLRIQLARNRFEKITEYLYFSMESERFRNIVFSNAIGAFYSGTSDVRDNLTYLVFDLDVSKFCKYTFEQDKNVIFTLLKNVATAIIETMNEFGIAGYPVVKFSGSRGIHILYRLEKDVLTDLFKRINLSVYYYKLPSLYDLLREPNSPLKTKKSFLRLIASAIAMYSIAYKKIEVPPEIKARLGKTMRPSNLFKISSSSANKISILIDVSINGSGVIRTGFSVHFTTKKASIPIYSSKEGKFYDYFSDYNAVLFESEIQVILEHIKNNDVVSSWYSQVPFSAIITKKNIENLLRPDTLLPVIAVLLRFNTRDSLEHFESLFRYWIKHYQIIFFFNYAAKTIEQSEENYNHNAYRELIKMAQKCKIVCKKQVKSLIRLKLLRNGISNAIFLDRLKGLFNFEFYYHVSSNPFSFETFTLKQLIMESDRRREFLDRIVDLQQVILEILAHEFENLKHINTERKKVLVNLLLHINKLTNFLKEIQAVKVDIDEKKAELLKSLLNLTLYHNIIVDFLRKYYKFIIKNTNRGEIAW